MTEPDCLADAPVTEDEIDPGLHEEFGFDHSVGPAPVEPVAP